MAMRMAVFNDLNSLATLGVAISEVGRPFHVGFIYKEGKSETKFCHLRWHHWLDDEAATPTNCPYWFETDLADFPKRRIVAYLKKVVAANDTTPIPYSIADKFASSFDDATGEYIKTGDEDGLTCATFVLAVMERCGFVVLDTENWPERPDDTEWQTGMIAYMREKAVPEERIKANSEAVGCIRLRPEEVAAGFDLPSKDWTLPPERAIQRGAEIQQEITS